MDIAKEKQELKTKQDILVKQLSEVITQEQGLAVRKQQLVEEALRLNGEARLLNRLDGDRKQEPCPIPPS